jgi:hypothetical protein
MVVNIKILDEALNWIQLPNDKVHWYSFVNTVISLWFQKGGEFLALLRKKLCMISHL